MLVACGGGGGGNSGPPPQPVISSPTITTQPVSQTVQAETQVIFSVAATGEGALAYQWQRNGIDVDSATGPQHAFAAKDADNGSVWTVKVRNASPTVTTSQAATLTVTPAGPGISLFFGDLRGAGNLDGAGSLARLSFPRVPILDTDDSAYFSEPTNRAIRKVTAAGVASRFAGTGETGSRDGNGQFAQFESPAAMALDRQRGILYVVDGNRIRMVNRQGDVSTLIATLLGSSPQSVAVGPDGSVYYSAGNRSFSLSCCIPSAIYKIPPQGSTPVLFAGAPSDLGGLDGNGTEARFNWIFSLTTDSAGNVFVSDSGRTRLVAPNGKVSTLGNGAMATALFNDAAGGVYGYGVGDRTLKRISSAGDVSVVAELPEDVSQIALDSAGRIVFTRPHEIGRISANGSIQILAGTPEPSTTTALGLGYGLVVDSQGNVFTSLADRETANRTMSIRKYNPSGSVVPFGPSGDLDIPRQPNHERYFGNTLAIDGADNLYEADILLQNSQRVGGTIYKISPSGQISNLISSETAATPFVPSILTANARGDVFFVSEQLNPVLYKVSPAGVLTKMADLPESIRNGEPWQNFDLAADNGGNVYLVSMLSAVVYRIAPQGSIVTLAGQFRSYGQVDGQGSIARFTRPVSPAVDSNGDLFLKDGGLVRKIATDGTVSTVAGQLGKLGTQLGALPGTLADGPYERFVLRERLAVGKDDILYVESDKALLKIRMK